MEKGIGFVKRFGQRCPEHDVPIEKKKNYLLFQDLLSKSDPYLEFSRQTADGVWLKVHRTEV